MQKIVHSTEIHMVHLIGRDLCFTLFSHMVICMAHLRSFHLIQELSRSHLLEFLHICHHFMEACRIHSKQPYLSTVFIWDAASKMRFTNCRQLKLLIFWPLNDSFSAFMGMRGMPSPMLLGVQQPLSHTGLGIHDNVKSQNAPSERGVR